MGCIPKPVAALGMDKTEGSGWVVEDRKNSLDPALNKYNRVFPN